MGQGTARGNSDGQIAAGLKTIKDHMPETYADIQKQAAGPRGNETYALVRRSLRGDANCFYAIEAGRVVGTPFDQAVTDPMAALMVRFGCTFLVIWPVEEGASAAPAATAERSI